MSSARRRGRPAPLRWSGAVALAGVAVLAAGAYLQYGDDHAGASSAPTGSPVSAASSDVSSNAAGRQAAPGTIRSPAPSTMRTTTTGTPTTGTASTSATTTRAGRPTGIAIPQLDVSAPVVSINAVHAALTPPSDPSKVGWWSAGAQPGAGRGSAVITGHTVHNGGGAFDNLGQLAPGSVVMVATARGQLQYRVSTVTTYRKAILAKRAAQVFDQSVRGRLVLVTCEDWNGQVYLSNVVVIALPMA